MLVLCDISLATIHMMIHSVVDRENIMQAAHSVAVDQDRHEKVYQANQELLAAIEAMKQETVQQSGYYREQLEAIFRKR